MRTHQRIVIAHHLVLHGYGMWLPNDPRGSGSEVVREPKLADLGLVHHGRKAVQPPREEVSQFYCEAVDRLDFPLIWFDEAMRQALADAFAEVIQRNRYLLWACAILRNHVHLCIRRHRDDAVTMWQQFAEASRACVRRLAGADEEHPVWSDRPYKVFLYEPADVQRVVAYIEQNPIKEGLAPQRYAFVTPYDGWPHARGR